MTENTKEIRWRQRFHNFDKAFTQLSSAVKQFETLSDLEKEGLIQRFEYSFELAWKTMKDYLESQAVEAKFPREVIKQAFHYEIITDGDAWMDMLEKRNLIAHTYNEKNFNIALDAIINSYFGALQKLHSFLTAKK